MTTVNAFLRRHRAGVRPRTVWIENEQSYFDSQPRLACFFVNYKEVALRAPSGTLRAYKGQEDVRMQDFSTNLFCTVRVMTAVSIPAPLAQAQIAFVGGEGVIPRGKQAECLREGTAHADPGIPSQRSDRTQHAQSDRGALYYGWFVRMMNRTSARGNARRRTERHLIGFATLDIR